MDKSSGNPALVIVILWGISILTTAFLFAGSANVTYGIVVQGICMIGSATYLNRREKATRQPV